MARGPMQIAGGAAVGLLVAGAILAGCSSDGSTDASGDTDTSNDAEVTPGRWDTFGYDLTNSRFNADESVVSAETAGSLEQVWAIEDLTGVASTPAVSDGVVYFGDWTGLIHAVDAETGEERWSTQTDQIIMSSATVTDDAVYVANNSHVFRLDKETGEILWDSRSTEHPIAISPSSPVVAGGLVIQGVASGELMLELDSYSFRGVVVAFDEDTGEKVWETFTTPGDDTGGHGVGVWSTPSVDEELGLLFVGAGNTYEPPAAELSDSIIALDLATGEVAWSTQFTYPDVWSMNEAAGGGVDGDVGAGPNLWESGGRAMVGGGDKRGVYHALDRETGEVVWETEMTPGSLLGGVIGTSAYDGERLYVGSNVGNPDNNGPTGTTELLALDPDSGDILWTAEMEGAIYAPVTVVPGVVFVGTTGAQMFAYDAETGEELWSFETPDQVGGGASVVDGTVYWGYGYSLLGTGTGEGGLYAFRPGDAPSSSAGGDDDEELSAGAELYRKSCASCHGSKGQGGTGPDLTEVEDRLTVEEHIAIVHDGRGSQMPSFEGTLTDEEIATIVEYERTELGG